MSMMCVVTLASVLFAQQTPAPTNTLPDTPQGKHVQAWIAGFNSGDEKKFIDANKQVLAAEALATRTDQDRADLFKRMRGDFGTLKIDRVVKATATEIVLQIPLKDGVKGSFRFTFEEKAPFKITGMGVEVDNRGGLRP